MKIGIMGTHGVGKTTKVNELASIFSDIAPEDTGVLSEVVRRCPFPVNENASINAQRWIFFKQFTEEIELQAAHEILICDRTVLDSLAYAQYAGFQDFVSEAMYLAVDWLKTYDIIYWLRPSGRRIEDDGFRSTSENYQQGIDMILAHWVDIFEIKTCRADEKRAVITAFIEELESRYKGLEKQLTQTLNWQTA